MQQKPAKQAKRRSATPQLSRPALPSLLPSVFIRVISVCPRLVHCSRTLSFRRFAPCRGGSQRVWLLPLRAPSSVHMLHNLHDEECRVFRTSSNAIDTFVHITRIFKNCCICINGPLGTSMLRKCLRATTAQPGAGTKLSFPVRGLLSQSARRLR